MDDSDIKFLLVYTTIADEPNIHTQEIKFSIEEGSSKHEFLSNVLEGITDFSSGLILTEEDASHLLGPIKDFLRVDGATNIFSKEPQRVYLEMYIYNTFHLDNIKYLYNGLATSTRKKDVVIARHLYYTLLYVTGYGSLSKIGKSLSIDRDHATVLNSIKVINNMIDTRDTEYFNKLEKVIKHFKLSYKFSL